MRLKASEMNSSKGIEEAQSVSPEGSAPTPQKKRCRINSKTVIWIDRDANEQETIEKYLADRQLSQRTYDVGRNNK